MIDRSLVARFLEMGCCGCFGFTKTAHPRINMPPTANHSLSQECLLEEEDEEGDIEDGDDGSYNGGDTDITYRDDWVLHSRSKRFEEIIKIRIQNGIICREFPVKETHKVFRTEDENGNKMVNEYVREYRIGSGSYGKVVLYQSRVDGKHYAIKAFHKSHLLKLRVGPSETAMSDVLREVLIMKTLNHPNIVNLVEVMDDPDTDNFYMVLEYVDGGKWACEGCGPTGGVGENTARKFLRDIVSGLMYLHSHNIVHGDIKPDNLLITSDGTVKIADFSVSQVFEDENDELRRSPGTPVFTAPECCLGLTYHGKTADTWAVGVTLYCMVIGEYPFLGDTLQDTYDKIVHNPILIPDDVNKQLKGLLEGLLCKDPEERLTLEKVAAHAWVIEEKGRIPDFVCWCKRKTLEKEERNGNTGEAEDTNLNHTTDQSNFPNQVGYT